MPSLEKLHIILVLKGNFQNVPKKCLFTASVQFLNLLQNRYLKKTLYC